MSNPLAPVAECLFGAFRKAYEERQDTQEFRVQEWDETQDAVKEIWYAVAKEAIGMSDMLVPLKAVVK